jgi:hypothetical protein
MTVSLGGEAPSWGLSRWNGGGLRFRPDDGEGFSLRGDRRQLLYKGRKRSHRFTILGQDKFEYDCILNKEPDTNTVTLIIEGAERYDFFRQPDFVHDPFLKGSYAVYKKETFIGEGTGKLCHIHRPKIIDSRGRQVWGALSIVGDRLLITMPEGWLADAAYPVIVDPVIGTSTIGSLTPESNYAGRPVGMSYQFGVNRFLAPEKIKGACSAYFYCYDTGMGIGDYSPRVFDSASNKPGAVRSKNEQIMRTKLWEYNAAQDGNVWGNPQWKTVSFEINGQIEAGSDVWFGGYGWGVWTKYDYGGEYYRNSPEVVITKEEEELYDEETGEWYWTEQEDYELPDFIHNGKEKLDNYILSWYFAFESSSFNYARTLTQGVKLTDARKLTAAYKKTLLTVLKTGDTNMPLMTLARKIAERASALDGAGHLGGYFRGLFIDALSIAETSHLSAYCRKQEDTAHAGAIPLRSLFMAIRLATVCFARDFILKRFLKSNEDIVLKSPVCRGIEIESRIH